MYSNIVIENVDMTSHFLPKNKSVKGAYILWFISLFGWLGLHRFYLKKRKTAILWICTLGVFGFGSVADLFFLKKFVERYNNLSALNLLERELTKMGERKEDLVKKQKFEEASIV